MNIPNFQTLNAVLYRAENGCSKWRSLPSYLLKEQLSILKSEMIKAEIEKAKPKEESKPVAAFPSSGSAGKLKWRKYSRRWWRKPSGWRRK